MIERLRRLNWIQFAGVVALIAAGTVAIWSAGNARSEAIFHGKWLDNLATAAFGLVVYFALALTDYRRLVTLAAVPAYAVALGLLALVLLVGTSQLGGKRWLWFFQPSEVSKLCILMMLAWMYGLDDLRWRGFGGFCLAGVVIGVPALLILKEPDLGTALTLVPACLAMLLVAGVWRTGLVTIMAVMTVAAVMVIGAVGEAERPGTSPERRAEILSYVPLKPHQVKRIKVFLYPDDDIHGAGYNDRQAKLAIASGGVSGKGIGKGESNRLAYLPQAVSMNDFIFCVWAEETGFIGNLVLLALFGTVLVTGAWTAYRATDECGRMLALGVSMLIFAHVFINIAMSIGLVPITGLPLPFISAGRTFLVVVLAGLGLTQSVAIYGRENLTWESSHS